MRGSFGDVKLKGDAGGLQSEAPTLGVGSGLGVVDVEGDSKNLGVVTTFWEDGPANPNLFGAPARGVWGDVTVEGGSGFLNALFFSGTLSSAWRDEILGALIPESRCALAFAAARAKEEMVGAAKLALDRVLLARFNPMLEAGVTELTVAESALLRVAVDSLDEIESVGRFEGLPAVEGRSFCNVVSHAGMAGRITLGPDTLRDRGRWLVSGAALNGGDAALVEVEALVEAVSIFDARRVKTGSLAARDVRLLVD